MLTKTHGHQNSTESTRYVAQLFMGVTLLLIAACTNSQSNHSSLTASTDWHPKVNHLLHQIAEQHQLFFNHEQKLGQEYCQVSYEGYLRSSSELINARENVARVREKIKEVLNHDYPSTSDALEPLATTTTHLPAITQVNDQLLTKARLKCLEILMDRQIAKYNLRLGPNNNPKIVTN